MSKPQVLICANQQKGIVWSKEEQASKLGAVAEVIVGGTWLSKDFTLHPCYQEFASKTRAEFFSDLESKYANIVGIYRHNDSAFAIGVFDKELIEKLPSSVKFICHNGAGYDQIDIEACTARGIQVSHTPGAVDDATATVGAYLTISALRGFHKAEINVHNKKWKSGLQPARDPEHKTVGIIGMGGIGSAMARRLLGFDMKIIYYNRKEVSPPPSFPCTYISSMDELLKQADVVSLNLPLNDQTKGSFGKKQFETMKKGSVLINTARGAVVDEEAMIEALESGHLSSAGLDVFPDEPNVNPKLLAMDNITILPHMGTETRDSQKKMEILVLDNLISAVTGKGLLNQVPEQKK
ncbi:hypothetical protein P7C73_g849, partial [Tremellales sp. Uapishka_1]